MMVKEFTSPLVAELRANKGDQNSTVATCKNFNSVQTRNTAKDDAIRIQMITIEPSQHNNLHLSQLRGKWINWPLQLFIRCNVLILL